MKDKENNYLPMYSMLTTAWKALLPLCIERN